ncbi:MAG: sigma-70 family RNA polymerase sigma factor [Deltaproteobacteria bacterium]|nr:sigma-70 family RNA polymerase sigma factor [Deltaproteobacteria bacterium]
MTRLIPVLRMQISILCQHMGHDRSSNDRQDLLQDALVELFRSGAQELRRWSPQGGLSLEGFVRLIARRFVARKIVVKAQRRERFLSTAPDALDAVGPIDGLDDNLARQHDLDVVLRELHARMSDRDRVLFTRLFIEEQPSAAVAREVGMSIDALKKWRTRIYIRAQRIATELRATESSCSAEAVAPKGRRA